MSVYLENEKILFIHIPKNAGSSILRKLEEIGETKRVRTDKSNGNWHSPYEDAVKNVQDIDKYFKFAVIRNPWSRVSSWYWFRKELIEAGKVEPHQGEYDLITNDFNSWLTKYLNVPWNKTWFALTHQQNFWLGNGNIKIIRYENYKQDLKELGLFSVDEMPHVHKTQVDDNDYISLFNNETKDLIYKTYKDDIKMFNYEFES